MPAETDPLHPRLRSFGTGKFDEDDEVSLEQERQQGGAADFEITRSGSPKRAYSVSVGTSEHQGLMDYDYGHVERSGFFPAAVDGSDETRTVR